LQKKITKLNFVLKKSVSLQIRSNSLVKIIKSHEWYKRVTFFDIFYFGKFDISKIFKKKVTFGMWTYLYGISGLSNTSEENNVESVFLSLSLKEVNINIIRYKEV